MAEPGELVAGLGIGHAVEEADRRAAEMRDPGLDQIRVSKLRRASDPQSEFEGREAAAAGLHVLACHADCRGYLQHGIDKSVNKGGEGEAPKHIKIGRLYPTARGRDGAGHRPQLGTRLGRRPFPNRDLLPDRGAPFDGQPRRG